MHTADDAERRGDADGALRVIAANPVGSDGRVFWNPARVGRLLQLVHFAPILPAWATSRWILEQALIQLDPALRPARDEAMRIAVELRGGPQRLAGVDRIDARVKVMDHDWVHRQLLLYEYGGLAWFLDDRATSDLVAGADSIGVWCDAPLRAVRLEARAPSVLHWTDLATGEEIVVPNLGAAVLEQPGEHALARVVPTAAGPMFDGVPLGVSAATARAVADEPTGWLDALRAAAGTEDYFADLIHGNFLLTDVPTRIAMLALVKLLPPGEVRDIDEDGFARATVALARRTVSADGTSTLDLWPCLAVHLLAPETLPYLADHLSDGDDAVLAQLADGLPTPAREVCVSLLERGSNAA